MLGSNIESFHKSLEALREFVGLIGPFLEAKSKEAFEANVEHLGPIAAVIDAEGLVSDEDCSRLEQEFGTSIKVDRKGSAIQITLKGSGTGKFKNALEMIARSEENRALLYRSSLISLVSSAEWFFSRVLETHFTKFPDSAGIREKTLTLADL